MDKLTEEQKIKELKWRNDLTEIVKEIYNGDETYQYEGIDKVTTFVSSLLQKEREAGKRQGVSEIQKELPKELGFDDYDKHIHTYVYENRGNCGICGLSFKKAGLYEMYNNAIFQVKNLLRKKLKSLSKDNTPETNKSGEINIEVPIVGEKGNK